MVRDLAVLESLNQQVLDALPSGILFCDTDYIVRRVNACYAALLGGKVSSILGRPLTELNPATRAPIVIKNGKPELGDLCTLPLFGDNYKFVVNRVPVRDNQGDVIGMVSHILFTDPNELKELHDKIDLLQKKKKIYNKSNNSSCTRYNVDSIPCLFVEIPVQGKNSSLKPCIAAVPTRQGNSFPSTVRLFLRNCLKRSFSVTLLGLFLGRIRAAKWACWS